jgi:hypothetical protein
LRDDDAVRPPVMSLPHGVFAVLPMISLRDGKTTVTHHLYAVGTLVRPMRYRLIGDRSLGLVLPRQRDR